MTHFFQLEVRLIFQETFLYENLVLFQEYEIVQIFFSSKNTWPFNWHRGLCNVSLNTWHLKWNSEV